MSKDLNPQSDTSHEQILGQGQIHPEDNLADTIIGKIATKTLKQIDSDQTDRKTCPCRINRSEVGHISGAGPNQSQ